MTADKNAQTPAPQEVWTVGRMRDALALFPDDLPLVVSVPVDDVTYESYAVTEGPYHQVADWGDGCGLVADERYVGIDAFAYARALRDELEIGSGEPTLGS